MLGFFFKIIKIKRVNVFFVSISIFYSLLSNVVFYLRR